MASTQFDGAEAILDNGRKGIDNLKVTIKPDISFPDSHVIMEIQTGHKAVAEEIAKAIKDGISTYPVDYPANDPVHISSNDRTIVVHGHATNERLTKTRFQDAITKAATAELIDPEFVKNFNKSIGYAVESAQQGVLTLPEPSQERSGRDGRS